MDLSKHLVPGAPVVAPSKSSIFYLNLHQFCKINGSCSKANVKNQEISDFEQSSNINDFNTYSGHCPDIWVNSINKAFESLWKISSYWIENPKEVIAKPFDYQISDEVIINSGPKCAFIFSSKEALKTAHSLFLKFS